MFMGKGLGTLGVIWWSWSLLLGHSSVNSPCLLLDLSTAIALYFFVLISRSQSKDIWLKKSDVLSLHGPLLQLHPDLFHSILLPTVLACYCQQSLVGYTSIWLSVFETDTLTFIFWTSTPTCVVFLVPFILSHFLFFRHVTKLASGTPVPSSQRTVHSLILGILQFSSLLCVSLKLLSGKSHEEDISSRRKKVLLNLSVLQL